MPKLHKDCHRRLEAQLNLKNYTSGVPVETTISRIEMFLVGTGLVTGIGKEYKGRTVTGIVFSITHDQKKLPINVKVKADIDACLEFFWKDYCASSKGRGRKSKDDFTDQAARTAWKLQEDWIRVETSLILLKQRTVLQSFMACVWDGEQTYFERLEAGGFKQLQLSNG